MNTDRPTAKNGLAEIEGPRHAAPDEVPVLDLTALNQGGDLKAQGDDLKALAAQLRDACTQTAFFYIANHGVPEAIITQTLAASRRFFEGDPAIREGALRNRFNRGYLPIGTSKVTDKEPDLKDSFDLGVDLPLDHPAVAAGTPFHGPNHWPQMPDFRAPVEAYFDAVWQLGLRLLRLFAHALDLPEDYFTRLYATPNISTRLLHYPKPPEDRLGMAIGSNEHTDFGVITILYQDPAGGLELQKPDGEWIAAPYLPGTFVINLGDLMARWTNDLFRSNRHRVVNRLGRERYSIATFFNPTHETVITCLPTCLGPGGTAKYQPIGAGQYVSDRIRAAQYR